VLPLPLAGRTESPLPADFDSDSPDCGSTRLIMPNYQQDAKVTKPFFQNYRNFGSQIRNALRLLIDY
jgi:hypothetical protein